MSIFQWLQIAAAAISSVNLIAGHILLGLDPETKAGLVFIIVGHVALIATLGLTVYILA